MMMACGAFVLGGLVTSLQVVVEVKKRMQLRLIKYAKDGTEVVLSGCPTEALSRYRLYGAAEPPPPPVAVPSPPPPPLECAAECKVRVSIEHGTLLRNNLGGLGPWRGGEAEVLLGRVGELDGRSFDLRIRNTSTYHAPRLGGRRCFRSSHCHRRNRPSELTLCIICVAIQQRSGSLPTIFISPSIFHDWPFIAMP